ncbi:MAG: DUF2147 domain-containing protein [Rudaea sp.]
MPSVALLVLLAGLHTGATTTRPTPVGVWQTVDDHTHRPRAIVRIDEHDGTLSGRIVHLFRAAGEDPAPRCAACDGSRHDRPVLGMTILWNLRRHGDIWDGGRILDPESGDIYRCRLRLVDDGKQLQVRGYIGFALFGRSQSWTRMQ